MLRKICRIGAVFCLGMALMLTAGVRARAQDESPPAVQPQKIRISAAGNLVDFRFRIIDPEKASYLVDRKNKAYMIDQSSGKVLSVPTTAKVGPLRQTVRYGLPKSDRVYFILFGNPHVLKSGDKVTVVIGDFKAENIVIE